MFRYKHLEKEIAILKDKSRDDTVLKQQLEQLKVGNGDFDFDINTLLVLSITYSNFNAMQVLLEMKADYEQDYNAQGDSPLMEAVTNYDSIYLKALLEHKADPNYYDPKCNETVLMKSCLEINASHFQLLIEYKADIYTSCNNNGSGVNSSIIGETVFDCYNCIAVCDCDMCVGLSAGTIDGHIDQGSLNSIKLSLESEVNRRKKELLIVLTSGVYNTEDPNKVVRTMLPLPIPGGHIQLYEFIVEYAMQNLLELKEDSNQDYNAQDELPLIKAVLNYESRYVDIPFEQYNVEPSLEGELAYQFMEKYMDYYKLRNANDN
jgi:hypothetical protein